METFDDFDDLSICDVCGGVNDIDILADPNNSVLEKCSCMRLDFLNSRIFFDFESTAYESTL